MAHLSLIKRIAQQTLIFNLSLLVGMELLFNTVRHLLAYGELCLRLDYTQGMSDMIPNSVR